MNTPLPQPVGKQREVLALPAQGHTVVLGTAGSGKTTLAVHRALYLAYPNTDHCGNTLLATFNRTLAGYVRHFADSVPREVDVTNYHTFARGYLSGRGKLGGGDICDPRLVRELCSTIVKQAREGGVIHPILQRPVEFLCDEFRWLAQHGIRTVEQYVSADRVRRAGTRVVRGDRPVVFDLYRRYRDLRRESGWRYDWDDLSHTVLSELAADEQRRRYRHVVIDEGQDFSPMMLRSLAELVPADGSLTFFGDMAQQIYGNRMSWRNAGINVQSVWEFQENYRNTRQIARLALAVAAMPSFTNDPDLVEPRSPTADGPPPALVSFPSEAAETEFVVAQARRLGRNGTVAILVRDRRQGELFAEALAGEGTKLDRSLNQWPTGPGIFHGTYHSAKGLEFDSVLLPRMSAEYLPHPPDVGAFGLEDAMTRDQHLIYVAITRARSDLILTLVGELTSVLPQDSALYGKSSP